MTYQVSEQVFWPLVVAARKFEAIQDTSLVSVVNERPVVVNERPVVRKLRAALFPLRGLDGYEGPVPQDVWSPLLKAVRELLLVPWKRVIDPRLRTELEEAMASFELQNPAAFQTYGSMTGRTSSSSPNVVELKTTGRSSSSSPNVANTSKAFDVLTTPGWPSVDYSAVEFQVFYDLYQQNEQNYNKLRQLLESVVKISQAMPADSDQATRGCLQELQKLSQEISDFCQKVNLPEEPIPSGYKTVFADGIAAYGQRKKAHEVPDDLSATATRVWLRGWSYAAETTAERDA